MKPLIMMMTMLVSGSVFAGAACNAPKNDFDGLYCLNKIYQEADDELNAGYQQLMGQLDETGRQILRAKQNTWIKVRNTMCSRHEEAHFYVDLSCATTTTIQRAQFIQDRLRECRSTGCLSSKL